MSNLNPETRSALENPGQEDTSFAEMLSDFEQQHSETGGETIQGVVVSVNAETVLVDIGRKTEGALLRSAWNEQHAEEPKVGETIPVVSADATPKVITNFRFCTWHVRRIGPPCSARSMRNKPSPALSPNR